MFLMVWHRFTSLCILATLHIVSNPSCSFLGRASQNIIAMFLTWVRFWFLAALGASLSGPFFRNVLSMVAGISRTLHMSAYECRTLFKLILKTKNRSGMSCLVDESCILIESGFLKLSKSFQSKTGPPHLSA